MRPREKESARRAGVFFRAASKATDRADTERAMNGEKKVPRRSWRASPPRARVGGAADPGPEGDAAGPPPAAGHAQGEAPGKPPSTAKKSLRAMLHFGGGSSGKRKANFLPQQTGAVSADAKDPAGSIISSRASYASARSAASDHSGSSRARLDPNDRAGGSVSYLQQGSEDDPHDSQQSETGLQQGQRDGGKLAPDERPGEGRTPMNGPTELSREPSEEPSELSREPNRGGSVMSKPRSTLGQLAGADTAFAHANVRMQSSFSQDFGAGLPNGPVTLTETSDLESADLSYMSLNHHLGVPTSVVTAGEDRYADLEATEMLHSTSQMYPVHDLEAAFMDIYRQDLCDVSEIRQNVDRLQRQVKELRALMREMARVEMRRLAAAATIIQAWWRGHLVRRKAVPLLRRARRVRLERESCRSPDVMGMEQLRRECLTVGLVEKPAWEAVLSSARNIGDQRQAAAVRIQSFVRGWLIRRRFRNYTISLARRCQAATRFQAAWRGYAARKASCAGLSLRAARAIRRPLIEMIEKLRAKVAESEKNLAAEQEERRRQDTVLQNLMRELEALKMQAANAANARREAHADVHEAMSASPPNHVSYSQATATKRDPAKASDGPPIQPMEAWTAPANRTSQHQGAPCDTVRFATAEDYDYLKAEVDCMRLNLERLYLVLAAAGMDPDGRQPTRTAAAGAEAGDGLDAQDITLLSFSNEGPGEDGV